MIPPDAEAPARDSIAMTCENLKYKLIFDVNQNYINVMKSLKDKSELTPSPITKRATKTVWRSIFFRIIAYASNKASPKVQTTCTPMVAIRKLSDYEILY